MCSEAVLKYLQSTNRPYSANDIFQNLHNAYSKNSIQKSLDELAEKGSLREKVYGKQKVILRNFYFSCFVIIYYLNLSYKRHTQYIFKQALKKYNLLNLSV